MENYSIIPSFSSYPISTGIYLISGTPFLYLKQASCIILGDIHLGIESSMFMDDTNRVSNACKELTDLLSDVITRYNVNHIICNGDIKHNTSSIKVQEVEELKYFVDTLIDHDLLISFIKGNHDTLLEFLIPYVNFDNINMTDYLVIDNIMIRHGHDNFIGDGFSTIIISHEHPAYTFYGFNRARVKLPAFVSMNIDKSKIIILPAANTISSGTNYPPKTKKDFLSPFLQEHGNISTMEIFPYDISLGIFELPPVSQWQKKYRNN